MNQTRFGDDFINKITKQLKDRVMRNPTKNLTHVEIQVHQDYNKNQAK